MKALHVMSLVLVCLLVASSEARASGLARWAEQSVVGMSREDANREADIEEERLRRQEAERRVREDYERSRREEERRAAEDIERNRLRSQRWYGDNR